jgi:hypothetical protein
MLIPWEDQLGIGKAFPHPDIPLHAKSDGVRRTGGAAAAAAAGLWAPVRARAVWAVVIESPSCRWLLAKATA